MMDESNKICPLFYICSECNTLESYLYRKEDCAWWVEDKQKCAIAAGGERSRGK